MLPRAIRTPACLSTLAALAVATYWPCIAGEFVYDDRLLVATNPAVRGPVDLAQLFGSPMWASTTNPSDAYYRPLTMLSLALDDAVGHGDPRAFHATSLALHVLSSWLLFAIARRWLGTAAALGAAALFAVHPAGSEAVAWISARGPLLAGTLSLAAAHCWLRRTGGGRAAAAICLLAALLAHELAAVGLLLLALVDRWQRGDATGWPWRLWPLAAAAAGAVLVRALAIGVNLPPAPDVVVNPMVAADWGTRAGTALGTVFEVARLLVWPAALSVDYSLATLPRGGAPWGLRSVAGGALVAGSILALWRGHRRAAVASGALALAAVAIAATPLNALWPTTSLLAERYLYVATAPVAVGLVAALGLALRRWRGAAPCLVLAVIAAAAARTAYRAAEWRSGVDLFESALRANPDSVVAHNNLAELYQEGGDADAAARHYQQALALYPAFVPARIGLLQLALAKGDVAGAETQLRAARIAAADHALLPLATGQVRIAQGDLAGAARALAAGIQRFGQDTRLKSNLAAVLYRQGDADGAEQLWRQVVETNPSDYLAHYNLGRLYQLAGDRKRAEPAYRRFLATVPAGTHSGLTELAADYLRRRQP